MSEQTEKKTVLFYCSGMMIAFIAGVIYTKLPLFEYICLISGLAFIILIYYRLEWGIGLLIATMLYDKSIVMNEISLTKIIILPIIGIGILKIIMRQKKIFIEKKMDSIILLLLLWMCGSIFYAKYLDNSVISLMTYFQIIATYIVIKSVITDEIELKNLIKIIIIFCFGMAIFSLIGIIKDPGTLFQAHETNRIWDSDRILGTSDDPNKFAQSLMFVLPLSIYLFAQNKIYFISSAIFLLLILSTFSRGGFLGLAVILALSLILLIKHFKKGIIHAFIIIIVIACSFLFLNKGNKLSDRINSIEIQGDGSINIRLEMIHTAIDMGIQNPVTGVGLNNFIENSHLYGNKAHYGRASHNGYLEIFATLGFPGFLLLIGLIYFSLKNIITYINYAKKYNLKNNLLMAKFIGISFIGYMVTSFFLALLSNKLYWVLLAFSSILFKCTPRLEKDKNNSIK